MPRKRLRTTHGGGGSPPDKRQRRWISARQAEPRPEAHGRRLGLAECSSTAQKSSQKAPKRQPKDFGLEAPKVGETEGANAEHRIRTVY